MPRTGRGTRASSPATCSSGSRTAGPSASGSPQGDPSRRSDRPPHRRGPGRRRQWGLVASPWRVRRAHPGTGASSHRRRQACRDNTRLRAGSPSCGTPSHSAADRRLFSKGRAFSSARLLALALSLSLAHSHALRLPKVVVEQLVSATCNRSFTWSVSRPLRTLVTGALLGRSAFTHANAR